MNKMTTDQIAAYIKEMIEVSGCENATIIAFGLMQRNAEIVTKGQGTDAELAHLKNQIEEIKGYYDEEEYEMTH